MENLLTTEGLCDIIMDGLKEPVPETAGAPEPVRGATFV